MGQGLDGRLDPGGADGVALGDAGLVAGHDDGDLHCGQHAIDVDPVDVAAAGGGIALDQTIGGGEPGVHPMGLGGALAPEQRPMSPQYMTSIPRSVNGSPRVDISQSRTPIIRDGSSRLHIVLLKL